MNPRELQSWWLVSELNIVTQLQSCICAFWTEFDTVKTKEMKRDTTPKSASGKLLRHAGHAVTNEAVAAATPLVKTCCCCKNSSKCKGGGRHLLQFELECSIYNYYSTEAVIILLKSDRIGTYVLFSMPCINTSIFTP